MRNLRFPVAHRSMKGDLAPASREVWRSSVRTSTTLACWPRGLTDREGEPPGQRRLWPDRRGGPRVTDSVACATPKTDDDPDAQDVPEHAFEVEPLVCCRSPRTRIISFSSKALSPQTVPSLLSCIPLSFLENPSPLSRFRDGSASTWQFVRDAPACGDHRTLELGRCVV